MKPYIWLNVCGLVGLLSAAYVNPYISDKRVKALEESLNDQQAHYERVVGVISTQSVDADKKIQILEHDYAQCLINLEVRSKIK